MTIYVQHILHVQTCTIFQSKHLANTFSSTKRSHIIYHFNIIKVSSKITQKI